MPKSSARRPAARTLSAGVCSARRLTSFLDNHNEGTEAGASPASPPCFLLCLPDSSAHSPAGNNVFTFAFPFSPRALDAENFGDFGPGAAVGEPAGLCRGCLAGREVGKGSHPGASELFQLLATRERQTAATQQGNRDRDGRRKDGPGPGGEVREGGGEQSCDRAEEEGEEGSEGGGVG